MLQFYVICLVSAILLSPLYINHDIDFRFDFVFGGAKNSDSTIFMAVAAVVCLAIAFITSFVVVRKIRKMKELKATTKKSEGKIKPTLKAGEQGAVGPGGEGPRFKNSLKKKDREVSWMELLTLESRSDIACDERTKQTKEDNGGCEDPPCKDELFNHPRPRPVRRHQQHTPSDGDLEEPTTIASHAAEELAGPRASETGSHVTMMGRKQLRKVASDISRQTLISDVHPTYTMRTLNITYNRPSRSEIFFDEKCREVHGVLESISHSDDMETASLIASTIAGDESYGAELEGGQCCKEKSLTRATAPIMYLTAFLIMSLLQITKTLEKVGDHQDTAYDAKVIYKQIRALASQCSSGSRMCEADPQSFKGRVRGSREDGRYFKPKPKSPRNRGEEFGSNRQRRFTTKSAKFSTSTRSAAYQGSETDRCSDTASSVTSVTVREEPMTTPPPKQSERARKKMSLGRFLDRATWSSMFGGKRQDADSKS